MALTAIEKVRSLIGDHLNVDSSLLKRRLRNKEYQRLRRLNPEFREKSRLYSIQYNKTDKAKLSNKNWRIRNKDKVRFYIRARQFRNKNAGYITAKIIQSVYEDNIKLFGVLTCILCLEPISVFESSIEHITPISRGGTNHKSNLKIACRKCNSRKGSKMLWEYRLNATNRYK